MRIAGTTTGRLHARIGGLVFWGAAAATLLAELAVELRRGPVFTGSEATHSSLSGAGESAAFLAAFVLAQIVVLGTLREILRLFSRTRPVRAAWDFAWLVAILWLALLAAKSRLAGFLGERLDFAIVRELGGGSLAEALRYAADELVVLAALLPLALAWLLPRRRLRFAVEPERPARRRRIASATLAVLAAALALLWAAAWPKTDFQVRRFAAPGLLAGALGAATDFDRDGWGLFSRPPDPHPLDRARYPMALDVPGNGVDEDGFGGDFRYAPPPAPPPPAPRFPGERRHVVLIVLESTRADALGKVWGGRAVAPTLDALAASGTAAREAYSNYGLTWRSLRTMFSGEVLPVPGGPSLFRDFRAAGYRVGVFSTQSEDFGGIAAASGMREASHVFVDAATIAAGEGRSGAASRTVADGRSLLREMDRRLGGPQAWETPTFLYVNLQAPHYPYGGAGTPSFLPGRAMAASEIRRGNRALVERNYWNSVAYADWLVGEVVRRLRAAGAWERSVVAVVGDHGEALFEDGYLGHGFALDAAQTRVPLVLSRRLPLPAILGQEDVRTLLLHAAGADVPPPDGGPVFQIVGYFAAPGLIGVVEQGGRWTTYEPATGRASTPESGPTLYRDLPEGSAARRRIERLVNLWMSHRWRRELAARAACGARGGGRTEAEIEAERSRGCP